MYVWFNIVDFTIIYINGSHYNKFIGLIYRKILADPVLTKLSNASQMTMASLKYCCKGHHLVSIEQAGCTCRTLQARLPGYTLYI